MQKYTKEAGDAKQGDDCPRYQSINTDEFCLPKTFVEKILHFLMTSYEFALSTKDPKLPGMKRSKAMRKICLHDHFVRNILPLLAVESIDWEAISPSSAP